MAGLTLHDVATGTRPVDIECDRRTLAQAVSFIRAR